MALSKLLQDLAFIQQLGDNPNADNNLTAAELKAWFDKAPLAIQEYVNTVLLPELEDRFVDLDDLTERVENIVIGSGFLPVLGGIMKGNINMSGNGIKNLPEPAEDGDAVPKGYVDEVAESLSGGISAAAQLANNAQKAADGKAERSTATATITATWTGSAAPYTQDVAVSGLLATDTPHITPVYSDTLATALAQKEAWALVSEADAGAGKITFTCFEDKPTTAIPIQIEVLR